MKKILTLLLFVPLVLQAQESQKTSPEQEAKFKADVIKPFNGSDEIPTAKKLNKKPIINSTVVGETYYDLQTNGSTARRIIAYPDGKISIVWTNAESAGFGNRGTGYNHFDGSDWMPLSAVDYRIENEGDIQTPNSIGWPNIGFIPNTKEFTITHSATNGGYVYSENNSIGGTNWSSSEIFPGGPIWGRIAQGSNNYLYLIGAYTNPTGGEDTARIAGITRPMVFYRSSDNGNTWIDENMMLPGYDSTRYSFGSGDSYSIDAQDSIVAIVSGTTSSDLALWKSTDWGSTWTKTVIDSFPVSPQELEDDVLFDSTTHNDGSYNVVIDNSGVAHVFWGIRSVQNDDDTDGSYSYYFFNFGIGYWNDQDKNELVVARVVDDNQNGTRGDGISSNNFARMGDGSSAYLYGGSHLVTMPSATIDGNGNVYCVYRSVVESPLNDLNEPILTENYSDVYVIYSTDGGMNWSHPQNLTKSADEYTESVFPSTYRRIVDGKLHLAWQEDYDIGTGAQNQHTPALNQIRYAAFDVDTILNDRYGELTLSINETEINNVFNVARTYPNPASEFVNVEMNLKKGAAVNVTMKNMLGQEIKNENYGKMGAGDHLLNFSTNGLKNGVYFITVTADGFTSTHKVVVQ